MHKINIYEFPDFDDDEENKVNRKLKEQVPFAVIGSNCVIQNGDRRVRARKYPWGLVEVFGVKLRLYFSSGFEFLPF